MFYKCAYIQFQELQKKKKIEIKLTTMEMLQTTLLQ